MAYTDTLQQRIALIFSQGLNLEVSSPDTDLLDTGLLDSLTFIDLLLQLEQQLGVEVSLEELEIDNFRSIARIENFIVNHKKPQEEDN